MHKTWYERRQTTCMARHIRDKTARSTAAVALCGVVSTLRTSKVGPEVMVSQALSRRKLIFSCKTCQCDSACLKKWLGKETREVDQRLEMWQQQSLFRPPSIGLRGCPMRRPRFRRRMMIDRARSPRYLLVVISRSVFSKARMKHLNQPAQQIDSWAALATHPRPCNPCLGGWLIVLRRTRCASHRQGVQHSQGDACDSFENLADLETCQCPSHLRETVVHTKHPFAHADQMLIGSVASVVSEDLCRDVVWPRHRTSTWRLPL